MGMPRYEVRRRRSRETARIALAVNAITQLFFVAKNGGKGIYMHFNVQSPIFCSSSKFVLANTRDSVVFNGMDFYPCHVVCKKLAPARVGAEEEGGCSETMHAEMSTV